MLQCSLPDPLAQLLAPILLRYWLAKVCSSLSLSLSLLLFVASCLLMCYMHVIRSYVLFLAPAGLVAGGWWPCDFAAQPLRDARRGETQYM